MAAKSSLKNMVLCLSAVCLVCSAILAAAYVTTEKPIAEALKANTIASIAKVLPEFDCEPSEEKTAEFEGVTYIYYEVPSVGYAVISSTTGFGGELKVMVGITCDGIVHNTNVLAPINETPGLGAKCQDDESFLKQFRSLDPAQTRIALKKKGGDLDAITASTITSTAYTLAVSNAVNFVSSLSKDKDYE